jgi:hypothetical protein
VKPKLDYAAMTPRAWRERKKLLEEQLVDLVKVATDPLTRDTAKIKAIAERREVDAELRTAELARTKTKDKSAERLMRRENTKLQIELEAATQRVAELEAAMSAAALRHDAGGAKRNDSPR